MNETFEDWVDSLDKEELEEAYQLGGSKDDIGLMRAYHIQAEMEAEFRREEAREMKAFENE